MHLRLDSQAMTARVLLVLFLAAGAVASEISAVGDDGGGDDGDGVGRVAWTDGSARLVFAAGTNASCPWLVSLVGEKLPTERRLEVCTRALPVAFEGFSLTVDSPGGERYFTKPLTSRRSDSNSTRQENPASDQRDSNGYFSLPGGSFYKVHEERSTWHEAKAACEAENAHLVIVNSKEEAAAIRAHLESTDFRLRERPFTLHAGFHMEFATPSGQPLSTLGYERWAPKQPAAPVCGRIDHDAWLLFGVCSQEERFMCEYDPQARDPAGKEVPVSPLSSSPKTALWNTMRALAGGYSQGQPPRDVYFKRNEMTLQYFQGNLWEDSKNACQVDGARLAVLESPEEAEALVDYFQSLPDGEPRGDTLLALRTTEPVDVFGNRMSASSYQRWADKIFPESCLCIDIKAMFRTCSCENTWLSFLCKISL